MGIRGLKIQTLISAVSVAAALALAVLGVMSLLAGTPMAYFPAMGALAALYYLAAAVSAFLKGGRRVWLRVLWRLVLTALALALAYLCYRCK